MSILLVNPPSLYHMPKFGLEGKLSYFELSHRQLGADGFWSLPGEHLGLRSIQASCRENGIPVTVINGQVLFHRSLAQTWEAIVDAAGATPPELVGFSGPCQVFEENQALAARIKERWPECVTVLGHDFGSLNWPRILEECPEFDAVCVGEGEAAFSAVAAAVLNQQDFTRTPGIATRGNRYVPSPAADFDSLPWPHRGDLRAVLDAGLSAAVYTSRGCPYRCTFCTTGENAARLPGTDRYRLRSLESVVAEIETIIKDYGVEHITLTDDLFLSKSPGSRERAEEFARRIIAMKRPVSFMIDCRVDSIDADLFRLLREAGLTRIFVGVETISPNQLDFYNKRYTRRGDRKTYIRRQLATARELGIEVIPGIITYHAETTVAELRDAVELIDACDMESAFFFLNRLIAYPGTPVYRRYKELGLLEQDWPVPKWSFSDTRIGEVETMMRTAEAAGNIDFHRLRKLFMEQIEVIESAR